MKPRNRLAATLGSILPLPALSLAIILTTLSCNGGGAGKSEKKTSSPTVAPKTLSPSTPVPEAVEHHPPAGLPPSNPQPEVKTDTISDVSFSFDPKTGVARFSPPGATLLTGADSLPAGFPEDLPLPGDAKIVSSLSGPKTPATVLMEVPGSFEDVTSGYKKNLDRQGWKMEKETAVSKGKGAVWVFTKDTRRAMIRIGDTKRGVQVTLTLPVPQSP